MGVTLLVTAKDDPTSDYLERAFLSKNKYCSRVNLDEKRIPKILLDPLSKKHSWIEVENNQKIKSNEISSIIIRRPRLPFVDTNDEAEKRFFDREILYSIRAFLESTNALWMNHPDANSFASSKPRNLHLAQKYGLSVPSSLISSDPEEISNWIKKHKNCVIKSISHGLIDDTNTPKMAFTKRLPQNFNIKKDTIPEVPIFLQDEINKVYDIRLIIVGNSTFSAMLPSRKEIVDWRAYDNSARWERFNLPEKINKACLKLCKKLNLEFAAIDLVMDYKNQFYFLELNPNGQWVWLEEECDLAISNAIVNHLTGEK